MPPELVLLAQICTNSFVGWGFAPDPTGELIALPRPHSWFRGGTPRGRGRGRGGKGRGGDGVGGIGTPPSGTGREWREGCGRRVGKGMGRKGRGGRGNKHTRFKTCGAAHEVRH